LKRDLSQSLEGKRKNDRLRERLPKNYHILGDFFTKKWGRLRNSRLHLNQMAKREGEGELELFLQKEERPTTARTQ
jgi:hypothetical protein